MQSILGKPSFVSIAAILTIMIYHVRYPNRNNKFLARAPLIGFTYNDENSKSEDVISHDVLAQIVIR